MSNDELYGSSGGTTAKTASAREFLAIVFRRKWIVIGLFLITTLTVLILTLNQKLVYISSGQVLVKRGEQESVLTPTRRITGQWEEEIGSEVQIAKSYSVLQLARDRLKKEEAAGKPAVLLDAKSVDAEVIGKTSVLALGYVDADPEVAQRVCDALIQAYLEFRQSDMSLRYPREFFRSELAQVKADLDRAMATRSEYSRSQNIVDPTEESRGLIVRRNDLMRIRAEDAANLAEARSMYEGMVALSKSPDIDSPTMSLNYSNEIALSELQRRMIDTEARVAQLRERFREDSPEVQSALETLKTIKTLLRREVDARLQMSYSRVATLEARVESFDRDLTQMQRDLESMPSKAARIAELDRQIKVHKDRIEELTKKSDLALVNEQTSVTVSALLLEPAGPARPANPRDPVRIALAPAFSLVVGIGLAFFADGLDLTVRTAGHAEEASEVPVLAAVGERRRRRRVRS